MKTRTKTITMLAVAVLVLTGTAFSQPGDMHNRGDMHSRGNNNDHQSGNMFFQRMRPMLGMLDLSDQQHDAIAEIMENAMESVQDLRAMDENDTHREDFIELFSSSTISVSEVEALLNERIDVMKETNSIMAEALVEVHGVLTEEQLAQLADFEPGSMEEGRRGSDSRGNRSRDHSRR